MDVEELVAALRSRGVDLWTEDGQIRFRSLKGQLLAPELQIIRSLKTRIAELLEQTQLPDDIPLEPRAPGISHIRLTPTQSMPWNYSPSLGSRIGTIAAALRLAGTLDIELLQECLMKLQLRHESLRTKIETRDGVPVQKIEPSATPFPVWRVIDAEPEQYEPLMRERIADFAARRIGDADGAVFGGMILGTAAHCYLVICVDHIVSDDWSIRIMLGELFAMYAAATEGRLANLPQLPVQFPDYAAWLWRTFPTWKKRNTSYWATRLSGAPCVPWRVRPSTPSAAATYTFTSFVVRDAVVEKLPGICKIHQVFPATVVLAAYSAAIFHYSGQRDLTMIVVDSGRYRPALFSMIGCLADHLHLRIKMQGAMTFAELFGEILREFNSASQHRDFGWLPQVIEPAGADVYFNYRQREFVEPAAIRSSLTIERFPIRGVPERQAAAIAAALPYKLGLLVRATGTALHCGLNHDNELFGIGDNEAIRDAFLFLLRAAIENHHTPLEWLFARIRCASPPHTSSTCR
jgi:hypothetical protein